MPVPTITLIGNLGADPELRTAASGKVFVHIIVIASSNYRNQQGEWEDGDRAAIRGVAFDQLAENISRSLSKGTRVIVQGRLREGRPNPNVPDARPALEMFINDIGPALSNATAQVTRTSSGNSGFSGGGRGGGFQGNQGNGNGGSQGGGARGGYQGGASYQGGAAANPAPSGAPANDPWSSGGSSDDGFSTFGGSGDFGGDSEEPAF